LTLLNLVTLFFPRNLNRGETPIFLKSICILLVYMVRARHAFFPVMQFPTATNDLLDAQGVCSFGQNGQTGSVIVQDDG
jgi:hypothetical protein